MKTKNLIVALLAAVAVVVAVKWFAAKPAPQTGTPEYVTGRAAKEAAAPAAPTAAPETKPAAAVTPETAVTASSATAQQPAAPARPVVVAAEEAETEEVPEPAVADFGTGQAYDRGLAANYSGNFPRVLIERGAVVPVTVTYPGPRTGEAVEVSVMDGGKLDGRDVSRVMSLDGSGQLRFAFHAAENSGIYRVTLRHGQDLKVLRFWAGPPQEIAATPLPKSHRSNF